MRLSAAVATRGPRGRGRPLRLIAIALAGVVVGVGAFWIVSAIRQPRRIAPAYDPPVLAGRQLWGACAGGFYARHGDSIVLTSTGHCTTEGTVAYDPDGITVRGVFGPAARDASCPYPGHRCAASDLNYLVVARDRIPWGHLNVVDLGTAGYRIIPPGTRPLACADIAIGDQVEINGRNQYRSGAVAEKGANLHPEDGDYFPCMIAARISVGVGDSGGAVLVRGVPAGVTSRSFGGWLGFTPLAEGLAQLGLDLCTTPDCGLVPSFPRARPRIPEAGPQSPEPAGSKGDRAGPSSGPSGVSEMAASHS